MAMRYDPDGTSAASYSAAFYRQLSNLAVTSLPSYHDNRFISRMNLRHLDFEAVRDSMLPITGKFESSKGGSSIVLKFSDKFTTLSLMAVNPPAFNFKKMSSIHAFKRTINLPVIRTFASCAMSSTSLSPRRSPGKALKPPCPHRRSSS